MLRTICPLLFINLFAVSVGWADSSNSIPALSKCHVLLLKSPTQNPTGAAQSNDIQIKISVEAISFGIYIHTEDLSVEYLVEELINPSGETVVRPTTKQELQDSDTPKDILYGPRQGPNPSHSTPALTTLLVPTTSKVKFKAGNWKFKIRGLRWDNEGHPIPAWGKTGPHVMVVEKRVRNQKVRSNPTRGRVYVSFFIGEGSSVNKVKAKEKRIQNGITDMIRIFGDAGIDIRLASNNLRLAPAPKKTSDPNFLTWGSEEIQSILKGFTKTFLPEISIPIVWSRPLRDLDTVANGFATTIGGPIGRPYPFIGGVFISEDSIHADRLHMDVLLAHELAHYLGLPHTFDQAVDFEDPFQDTASEDSFNLMEPDAPRYATPAARKLSNQQIWFLLRNPFIELY